MAKDNVPFHTVSFPVTLIGSREPWTRADQIKGFNWLTYYGGKFSTSQGRGVFMDQALDTLPRRLLALVPLRQRARVERLELHVGAVHRRGQQGPGRLVRQPGEPLPHPVGQALRPGRARRRRARRARGAARPPTSAEVVAAYTELMARQGAAEVGQRAAPRLGAGQRLLGAERAVEGREGRPRRGRGDLPHRDQRGARAGGARRRRSSPRRRPRCSRRSAPRDSTWPDAAALAAELAALAPGHPVAVPAGAVRQDHRRRAGRAGGSLRRPGS